MVFKNCYVLALWTKVASLLEMITNNGIMSVCGLFYTGIISVCGLSYTGIISVCGLQYRHVIPAPVDLTSTSTWLYKHIWITCQLEKQISDPHSCESKLRSVVRSSMYPYPGDCWPRVLYQGCPRF